MVSRLVECCLDAAANKWVYSDRPQLVKRNLIFSSENEQPVRVEDKIERNISFMTALCSSTADVR